MSSETAPITNEITPEQQELIVNCIRMLLGPPEKSEYEYTGVKLRSIESSGYYRLGDLDIYVDEERLLNDIEYHPVSLFVIGPKEAIDDNHHAITSMKFQIDLSSGVPSYELEKTIYDSLTGEKIRGPLHEEG